MRSKRYEAQYGSTDVRDAVNRAVADGWVIDSVKPNQKRGKSQGLFALYKVGMPAAEFIRLAEAFPAREVRGIDCLRWDIVRGFITLAPIGGQICLARLEPSSE